MTPDVFAELNPPYSTIVVDPPWPYPEGWPGFSETSHGGDVVDHRDLPYSAMSLDEIARLPVGDLAAPGSQLFLWTTNRYLFDARDICLGWGFNPARVLVWCKPPMGKGVGGTFASTTEFVVHARRATRARQVERAGQLIREAREEAGLTRAELHRLVRGGAPTGIVYRWEDDDSLPNPTDWARLQEVLPGLRGVERPCVPPPDRRRHRCASTRRGGSGLVAGTARSRRRSSTSSSRSRPGRTWSCSPVSPVSGGIRGVGATNSGQPHDRRR